MTQPTTGFTNPAISSGNAFAKLLDFQWRGISFPATSFRLSLKQDLVPHKALGRDGAHIEAVGRAPLEISVQIPLFNSIDPGPNESWTRGSLYPGVWRQLLAAFADKSTGDLQFPELGIIKCKGASFDTDWAALTSNGLPCTATWIETTDDPSSLAQLIRALSPIAGAISASQDVDDALPDVQSRLPDTDACKPTFNEFMRQVQAVFDTATVLSRRVAGVVDNLLYRCDAVEFALTNATKEIGVTKDTLDSAIPQVTHDALAAVYSTTATNDAAVARVTAWPLLDAIGRLRDSLIDVKTNLIPKNRAIGIWIPVQAATLVAISVDIAASIGAPVDITDLIRLNPAAIASPVVFGGTAIRFYEP